MGVRIEGWAGPSGSARPWTTMPATSTQLLPTSMAIETRGSDVALVHVRPGRRAETYGASSGQTNHSGTTWGAPSGPTVATLATGRGAKSLRAAVRSTQRSGRARVRGGGR